jgi:hypothetical protein
MFFIFPFVIFVLIFHFALFARCAVARLRATPERLGEGGGSQRLPRATKVESTHKRSDEPRPRLRQTASWAMPIKIKNKFEK